MTLKRTWFVCLVIDKKVKFFLFLPLLFLAAHIFGQQKDDAHSLLSVLKVLETRYGIAFSYADKNVADHFVDLPADDLSLTQCLNYLREVTDLEFEQLDDRFVAIRKPEAIPRVLCGYLKDIGTNEPVISAMVRHRSASAVTNLEGYFELALEEPASTLRVRHLGYQPLEIDLVEEKITDCLTINLTPKTVELEEVLISNYLVGGVSKTVSGGFEVKTRELQVLPGMSEPDVLYTMQALPGIQSANESVSDINIRGGSNDQSLILWDGIKMYQSSHFYGLITAFNPYFVDKVILTKNGTSARLGEGVSGTIEIKPDDDIAKEWSGGGGINLLSVDGYLTAPLSSRASISVAGRRSIADIARTPTYNNYFDRAFRNTDVASASAGDSLLNSNEDFYFYDLTIKGNYQISDDDKLSLSFLQIFNDLIYTENAEVNGVSEPKTSSLTQQSMASGIQYEKHWSPSVKSTLSLPVSWYRLRGVNNDIPNSQRLEQENEVLDIGFKIDTRLLINATTDVTGGVQLTEVGIGNLEVLSNPAFRRYIKEVNRNQVLFVDVNHSTPSNNTNISGGLRANYYSTLDQFTLEPRLAIHQKLAENVALEVLAEQKSQFTTQVIDLQNDFLGVEKRRWVLSNGESIPLVRSKQASVGLLYSPDRWLISAEPYVKLVKGIITSSQGFQNQFQYLRSSGSYQVFGVDLLVKRDFKKLSAWTSYALAKNRYNFPQLAVSAFPNNLDILHNLTVGTSYTNDRFQASTSVSWHSGRPYTHVNSSNPIVSGSISYDMPNAARVSPYFRIDLSGRYKFALGARARGQAGFSIWNLTGYENVLGTYYRIDDGNLKTINQAGLKLTPNMMFRVFF